MSSAGVDLILDLLSGQEVLHQKLLRELFQETNLARALDLWDDDYERPYVRCEAVEKLFDLELFSPGKKSRYIELKAKVRIPPIVTAQSTAS